MGTYTSGTSGGGNKMLLLLFTISGAMGDCIVNPDTDFPAWPPILTNEVGDIVLPTGEENNRQITVAQDQTVVLSCPGGGLTTSPIGELDRSSQLVMEELLLFPVMEERQMLA